MSDLSDLQQRVVDVMVQKMHLAPPPIDADLFETGCLDSLSFVSLLVHIEEEFGVQIDLKDLDLNRFQSIANIAEFIAGVVPLPAPDNHGTEVLFFHNASLRYAG
jgi:acyl carrier protein